MSTRAIAVLSLSLSIFANARAEDKSTELAKHQGKWSVTSMIRDDKEAPTDIRESITREVSDDHIVWKRDGESFAGTRFVIDAKKSPKEIDLIPDGGPATDKHVLGIYKFDGETLTICMADAGRPRPTAFEAKAGSKQTLQSFKRAKP